MTWPFCWLVSISAVLVVFTFAAYFFGGNGQISRLLRQFSMGAENNIGAWWSSVLFLLSAIYCLDRYAMTGLTRQARQGWLALALITLGLSFDEMSSLHEFVADGQLRNLIPIGICAVIFLGFALAQLYRGGAPTHVVRKIIMAFALLASIPMQEYFQHQVEWSSKLTYGIRAAVEEGTEIVAALILLASVRVRTSDHRILANGPTLFSPRNVNLLLILSLFALPLSVLGSYYLPYPGGPADWVAVVLFMLCAIKVVYEFPIAAKADSIRLLVLSGAYVTGSVMSSAIKLEYVFSIADLSISLRGIFFGLYLLFLLPILRGTLRKPPFTLTALCAAVLLAVEFWPQSSLLWRSVPPIVAILLFAIEFHTRPVLVDRRAYENDDAWQLQSNSPAGA